MMIGYSFVLISKVIVYLVALAWATRATSGLGTRNWDDTTEILPLVLATMDSIPTYAASRSSISSLVSEAVK